MASLTCKVETQNAWNKDERPCELFRRNAYRAPRGASGVPPCEHVRPQTVSADDTVVGYSEQTPMQAPLGNLKARFMIQFPRGERRGASFSSRVPQHLQQHELRRPQQHPEQPPVRLLDANAGEQPGLRPRKWRLQPPFAKSAAPAPSNSPSNFSSSSTAT